MGWADTVGQHGLSAGTHSVARHDAGHRLRGQRRPTRVHSVGHRAQLAAALCISVCIHAKTHQWKTVLCRRGGKLCDLKRPTVIKKLCDIMRKLCEGFWWMAGLRKIPGVTFFKKQVFPSSERISVYRHNQTRKSDDVEIATSFTDIIRFMVMIKNWLIRLQKRTLELLDTLKITGIWEKGKKNNQIQTRVYLKILKFNIWEENRTLFYLLWKFRCEIHIFSQLDALVVEEGGDVYVFEFSSAVGVGGKTLAVIILAVIIFRFRRKRRKWKKFLLLWLHLLVFWGNLWEKKGGKQNYSKIMRNYAILRDVAMACDIIRY